MRYLKSTIVFLFCLNAIYGQLSVTPNNVANTLAQTIAGFGVTVSNASISCTSNGAGTFIYTGTHLGLTSGVLLTTGNATSAAQPQSSFSGTDNGNNVSDPQLTAISSLATHNLCRLEFDFVPICPSLSIKYVFGSEEYPTFVGSINDAFGIFLTGPNPSGAAYNNTNIALLPNGQPVSINNVNSSSNSSSFVANYNLNYNDIVYGGYTVPVTSSATITPCQSYHIKFAIADASDGDYDSGVFIQYDGLSCTNSPTVTPHSQASSCSANTGSASVTVAGLTPTSYSWQPGGQSGSSITNQAPGTYTCVMSFSSACTTFTQSQVITITSPGATPTVAVSSNTPCPGTSLTFTATSNGTSYAWSGPNSFSSSAQNPSIPGATAANAGVYTLTVTNSAGCTKTATLSVNVSSSLSVTVNSATICSGGSATLTASGGSTYSWAPSTGLSATTGSAVTASPASPTVYTVTGTSAAGCTGSATSTVSISANPAVSVTSATMCSGGSATLTASGASTYTWSGSNLSTTTGSIVVASPGSSSAYTVSGSVGSCSATPGVGNVSVTPTPTATIGSNSPICVGATLNLTSGGGTTYAWSGPAAYTSSLQNPSITSASAANSGVYTVTVTTNTCKGTNTVNVLVVAAPTVAVSSNTPCPGGTMSLTATSNGSSYNWSGPASFASSLQNPTITGASAANSGVYTLTVSNATGCTSTITLNASISAASTPTAASSGTICAGQTLTLTTSSSGAGGSYNWSGPNGFTSIAQSPSIANAPTANSGVYSVTVTSSAGCIGTTTVNALVNANPTPTAGSNSPICAGATLSLTASGGTTYAWSGPGAYTSSLQNPTIASASVTNSGVYTVTATTSGCTGTNTVSVNVVASPTVAVSSNTPCAGSTLSLTATSNGNAYSWSGPASFTSSLQNPAISNASAANSGVYTLTVSNATGCTTTTTLNAAINAASSPTAASSGTICAGQTLTLTTSSAGTGSTYQWSGPNGFSSGAQSPSVANASTANSGVYTVTVTSSAGCTGTTSTSATINPLPTVTIGSNSPVCAGTTLSLTAGGGTAYAWSGPNGYTSSSQNPSINPATTNDSGVYTVTVTDQGCSNSNTVSATVNAIPTPTASSNSPICAGTTLNLTAGGGTTYSWSGPNSYASSTQNPSITGASTSNSGTYTVTATAAGCSASVTVNVTVNSSPTVTAGSNSAICAGNTLSLTASGGTTYSWSGPNSFTSSQQNPVIASATTADGGVYTVTATALGCSSTGTVSVTINSAIVASITLVSPACLNSNVSLTAPSGGSSYAWSGPNGFSSSSQNPTVNGVSNADAGVYTLSITTLGCVSTATANLSMIAPVSFSVTPTGQSVCKSHSASLLSMGQGGTGNYTYNWSPAVGISSPSSASVTATPATTQSYTVTVGDAACPTAPTVTAAVTVTVNQLPVITFSAPALAGCEPFCTSFSSSSTPAAQSVSWVFSDGQTATGTNISTICFNKHGNYDAKLIVQDVNGCIDSLSKPGYITVYPKPIADFTWNPLSPTIITNDVIFYDQSTLGAPMQSWAWNFGDYFVPASGNNSTVQNPEHVFANLGTYNISLAVVNQYGCRDSITKKITVEDEFGLYIPNAFSPSVPDGVNDVFNVKGTGFYSDSFEMFIFDRWGEQIYYTDDVMKGWDGSFKGGGPRVKQDVYVYKIIVKDFKDKKRQYVGHVTLL